MLKQGNHQFIPGSPAVHNNDNLTDQEAEWYLERYPHIAALFAESPVVGMTESPREAASLKPKAKRKRIAR